MKKREKGINIRPYTRQFYRRNGWRFLLALDAKIAFLVSNAILDLNDLTRIVVTHSLDEALLRRFDCVLTQKNGRITEFGSFDQLMNQKGYFYSLHTVSQ